MSIQEAVAGAVVQTAPTRSVTGYSKIEFGLAELRTKYAGAVFTVTTSKGMAEARAARGVLRDTRLLLERTRVDEKAEALAYGRLVDSEAKRIEAEILALESPIAAQVKREDDRKEAERQAKVDAENARVAAIRQRIAWIQSQPLEAVGKGSADLTATIDSLRNLPLTPELYGEFLQEAGESLKASGDKLTAMRETALANETEAARLKADRARLDAEEKERRDRQAKEDKERADRIAAEDAERARLRKIDDDARAAAKAEQDAKEKATRDEQVAASNAAAAAEVRRREQEAEQRRLERSDLEKAADPWRALSIVTEVLRALNRTDVPSVVAAIEEADSAFAARDRLAALDIPA